jgi:hypothetical protein
MFKHKKLFKQGQSIISLPLISLSLGSSLIWGCFDPSNENGSSEPVEPLTHESAHAIISSTMQSQSQSLEERLRFLDGDERLMEAFESIFGGADEECYFDYDEEGNEYEVCESYEDPESGDNQIRIDFMEGTEDMISSILEELAPELQIAEETQLTYRLNVNRLCESAVEDDWEDEEYYDGSEPQVPDEEGFQEVPAEDPEAEMFPEMEEPVDDEAQIEVDQDCLRIMEQEEPRVRLQAYGDGIQAELLLNQGQDTLVTAIVDTNLAKVSVDLGVLSRIIESISSSSEDLEEDESENSESSDFELQMSGVISLEMNTENPTQAIFSANVDQAIQIIGQVDGIEEINFTFPRASKVFVVSSDSEAPAFNIALTLPKLMQTFSTSLTSEYEYDEETGEEVLVSEGPIREILATLGGLNMALNLTLVDEGIESIIELGLGQESSSIAVDGQEIITVDLNPNHGRLLSFNFDHSSVQSESLLLKFASELHALKVDLKLGLIPEIEAPLGFADELYRLAFTSQNNALPELVLGGADSFIQILNGHFELEAERGEILHEAEGGMCINPVEDSEEGISIDEPIFEEESSEPQHPLASLEVSQCSAPTEE